MTSCSFLSKIANRVCYANIAASGTAMTVNLQNSKLNLIFKQRKFCYNFRHKSKTVRFKGKILKKYLFSFLLVLFFSAGCFAQNEDMKHYSDPSMNFDGWAGAEYIGNIDELDESISVESFCEFMEDMLSGYLEQVTKLSKNTTWLFLQAMEEWEYKPREVYLVFCAGDEYSEEGILIWAVVNDENDFLWCAFMIDEDTDFDEIFEME